MDITKTEERSFRLTPTISGSEYNDILFSQEAKGKSIFENEKYAVLNELREEGMKVYKSKDEKLIEEFIKKLKPL